MSQASVADVRTLKELTSPRNEEEEEEEEEESENEESESEEEGADVESSSEESGDNMSEQEYFSNIEKNPFLMPSNEEELFLMREKEKEEKKKERNFMNSLPIEHKFTKSSENGSIKLKVKKDYKPTEEDEDQIHRITDHLNALVTSNKVVNRRKEAQNMNEFIDKKRQMFLVQLSLDTKRSEIKKLERKAAAREKKLRDDEKNLEMNTKKFEEFIRINDLRAIEAVKNAEKETKLKQEKVLEIKKLQAKINQMKSEIAKDNDRLQEYKRYKEFLDGLTPEEVKKQWRIAREERKAKKQQMKNTNEMEEKDQEDEADEEVDMYFTHPEQLLEKFTELEENNLFLIERNQELEEGLDSLRQKLKENEKKMDEELSGLNTQIEDLNSHIEVEKRRTETLRIRTEQTPGAIDQKKILDELQSQVLNVYVQADFDPPANPDTLEMLAEIEHKLDELLRKKNEIMAHNREYLPEQEKFREKQRRHEQRIKKQEADKKAHQERVQKALKKAKEGVVKRVGRPLMFRSVPPQQSKEKKGKEKAAEDEKNELQETYMRFLAEHE